jgi:hypothetical protein
MSAYLTHLGFKSHFNEESFNKTYKISLKSYYSMEKVGNFNKAFDHVHHLFGKEGNIDHALNKDLHAHHQGHDNPIQDHTKHVFIISMNMEKCWNKYMFSIKITSICANNRT